MLRKQLKLKNLIKKNIKIITMNNKSNETGFGEWTKKKKKRKKQNQEMEGNLVECLSCIAAENTLSSIREHACVSLQNVEY